MYVCVPCDAAVRKGSCKFANTKRLHGSEYTCKGIFIYMPHAMYLCRLESRQGPGAPLLRPNGGTRGHIPRWLCLRNAVGAPLRRLTPSFFINQTQFILFYLSKTNPPEEF